MWRRRFHTHTPIQHISSTYVIVVAIGAVDLVVTVAGSQMITNNSTSACVLTVTVSAGELLWLQLLQILSAIQTLLLHKHRHYQQQQQQQKHRNNNKNTETQKHNTNEQL